MSGELTSSGYKWAIGLKPSRVAYVLPKVFFKVDLVSPIRRS